MNSYSRHSKAAAETAFSTITHAIVIAVWVIATLPPAMIERDSLTNGVVYIPPPDKLPGDSHPHEVVQYVTLARAGLGEGLGQGRRAMGNAAPAPPDETVGRFQLDTVLDPVPPAAPPTPPAGLADSIFTVLDVDSAVVRSANSAAPAYPLSLLEAHITGAVSAQYVVDTTGFADTASFTVIKASNAGFIDAVREALPYMRFKPAKIGPLKVKQLVEQTFTFRITADTTVASPKAKRPNEATADPSLRSG